MILPLLESQDQFLVNFDRIRSILNQSWANFGQKWNFDERKPANSELICSTLIEFVQCNEMGDFISSMFHIAGIKFYHDSYLVMWIYHVICDHFSKMILLHEPYYVMYKSPFNCHVKSNQFFSCGKKETCRDSVIIVLGKCCDPIGVIASSCWDGITLW